MLLPKLLREDQTRPFSYYWEGEMRAGMSAQGHLYALLGCFKNHERLTAFEKGCRLAENYDVILTVSQTEPVQYRLWIALSSRTDIGWLLRSKNFTNCGAPDAIAAPLPPASIPSNSQPSTRQA